MLTFDIWQCFRSRSRACSHTNTYMLSVVHDFSTESSLVAAIEAEAEATLIYSVSIFRNVYLPYRT